MDAKIYFPSSFSLPSLLDNTSQLAAKLGKILQEMWMKGDVCGRSIVSLSLFLSLSLSLSFSLTFTNNHTHIQHTWLDVCRTISLLDFLDSSSRSSSGLAVSSSPVWKRNQLYIWCPTLTWRGFQRIAMPKNLCLHVFHKPHLFQ